MRSHIEQFLVNRGPSLIAKPLKLAPQGLTDAVTVRALNQFLQQPLAAGQLDFLDERCVSIEVSDLQHTLRLTLKAGQLQISRGEPDVVMRGDFNDLLRIMSEDVDPDTLFFHRRLVIEGDTALGLSLKNCLDALEFSGKAAIARRIAGWPGSLVEKYQPLL